MSKRTFALLLLACVVRGTLWAADDPMMDDWKLNPSKSKLTDEMKVENLGGNKYSFDFGGGGRSFCRWEEPDDHRAHGGTKRAERPCV
jgi:hypothetical protein